MSSVKSRELKSLNKKYSIKTILYCFIIAASPSYSLAQDATPTVTSPGTFLNIFLSLLVVIGVILALAWLMRRFNVAQAGNGQMRVIASMVAGTKEKIMVIEVGDEQHLLGITSHNINHLAKLETPLKHVTASEQAPINPAAGFQQKLIHAMAQGMTADHKQTSKPS